MTIQKARLLIIAAVGLIGLAGCASSPEFAAALAPERPASSDVTGSIAMPGSGQAAIPGQPASPAAERLVILGVAY
jgi:hypothetical protein